MAYYDAFIAAWNAGGVPAGATGTPITSSMTTQQKLAALNGWTVSVQGPVIVPSYAVYNLIFELDWNALSLVTGEVNLTVTPGSEPGTYTIAGPLIQPASANQQKVFNNLSLPTIDFTPSKNADKRLRGAFAGKVNTLANFDAFQNTYKTTIPWWKSAGYPRAFDMGDVQAAGVH